MTLGRHLSPSKPDLASFTRGVVGTQQLSQEEVAAGGLAVKTVPKYTSLMDIKSQKAAQLLSLNGVQPFVRVKRHVLIHYI